MICLTVHLVAVELAMAGLDPQRISQDLAEPRTKSAAAASTSD